MGACSGEHTALHGTGAGGAGTIGGSGPPFHLIDGALLYIGSMELVPPRHVC